MGIYTVGFDLGTHQTKICIQDATNPVQKIYEFLEFEKLDGTFTVLLPSIVQINDDETVSYGFVDKKNCMIMQGATPIEKPSLHLKDLPLAPQLPKRAKVKYPPKPIFDLWKDSLLKIVGQKTSIDKWRDECTKIDAINCDVWKKKCEDIVSNYNKIYEDVKNENNNRKLEYENAMSHWEKSQDGNFVSFRYFKLSAFIDSGWSHRSFSAEEITVWYIANLLIMLREKLGDDISVQFGVPVGGNLHDDAIINRAYSLYIAAYDLSKKYNSRNEYLCASYKELRENTKICCVNEEVIDEYYFDDLPEAFAGLIAVTIQKKLGCGFHLLTDIGGGTTDMALFRVDSERKLPDVVSISSFTKGLNYIFEQTLPNENMTFDTLQDEFFENPDNPIFEIAISIWRQNLIDKGNEFCRNLLEEFNNSNCHHRRTSRQLVAALKKQPIIYCGGGSIYRQLLIEVEYFKDVRKIDKELLNIRHVRNEKSISDRLYPILAVSYGLASYEKPFEGKIQFTKLSTLFHHLSLESNDNDHKEHGLLDD